MYPKYKEKYNDEDVIISPADTRRYAEDSGDYPEEEPPAGVILCYQEDLFEYVTDTFEGRWVEGIDSYFDFYVLTETEVPIGVAGGIGIGAPATAFVMEHLIEYGVENIMAIEFAGCLQRDVAMEDIIVCDKALRNEGTSYHYLEPTRFVEAPGDLTETIEEMLEESKLQYHVGSSWTNDAFFRETIHEVEQYRDEGFLTVEMEAATTYSVARYRDITAAAMFIASDYVGTGEWEPYFHLTEEYLQRLFRIAKQALEQHCTI